MLSPIVVENHLFKKVAFQWRPTICHWRSFSWFVCSCWLQSVA